MEHYDSDSDDVESARTNGLRARRGGCADDARGARGAHGIGMARGDGAGAVPARRRVAPHLPHASCARRAVVACGAIFFVCIVAVFTLELLELLRTRAALAPLRNVVAYAHGGGSAGAPPAPLPAILLRFRALKRAHPPATGVDPVVLAEYFPHWGTVGLAHADLALAVAALAQRLPHEPPHPIA
jgi:hypothetical protein